MPTIKLTQPAVDKVKPPPSGRVEYFDTQLPGFGLRISASGRKTWIIMYRVNKKLVRETIGTLAVIPKVADARERARESVRKAQSGVHPVEERRTARAARAEEPQTFEALARLFLERHAERNTRPSTYAETKRALDHDVIPSWGSRLPRGIARKDLLALLDRIVDRGAPVQANRTLAVLRRLFNWAVERELLGVSPAGGVKMPSAERARDRALSDEEIKLFWAGCGELGWPFGPIFKLLLITAQRREELGTMEWREINLRNRIWTIPRDKAKNDRTHEVHLSDVAMEIVEPLPRMFVPNRGDGKPATGPEYLFTTNGIRPVSGFSRAKARLDASMLKQLQKTLKQRGEDSERADIPGWTLHDLRRTAASGMARIGTGPHIVDRILNHVSGTIRGVAAVYNRHSYLEERKAALDAWGRYVENLVRPRQKNVISLTSARG